MFFEFWVLKSLDFWILFYFIYQVLAFVDVWIWFSLCLKISVSICWFECVKD